MSRIDAMAKAAGFIKDSELTTSNVESKTNDFFGLKLVETGLMPEGWIGLRTNKGVHCIGPKGSFFVPAFDIQEALDRCLPIHTKERSE